jgi:hypothetical protein
MPSCPFDDVICPLAAAIAFLENADASCLNITAAKFSEYT